jgi:hypothetical protein
MVFKAYMAVFQRLGLNLLGQTADIPKVDPHCGPDNSLTL